MKTKKNPGLLEKEVYQTLKKFFTTDEEIISLALTYLGSSALMAELLQEIFPDSMKMPPRAKYGMVLFMMHYKVIGKIVRGEISPGDHQLNWLPVNDEAWKTAKDLEERTILVVKELYTQFKDEGKL